jgi:hypothetical protein
MEKCFARALAIAEVTGNQSVRARYLTGKARLARLSGKPVEAQALYAESREMFERLARTKDVVIAQIGLGFAHLDQEQFVDARASFHGALQVAWKHKIWPEVIGAVVGLAAIKGYEGQPQIAERWLQIAVAHPACPRRVAVEAEELRLRLAPAGIAHALDDDILRDLDIALENVVLELLC